MKRFFPRLHWLLLYSRLMAAIALLALAFVEQQRNVVIALCVSNTLAGLYGSIIAKGAGRQCRELRQMHVKTDTIFWFSCLFYLCIRRHDFLQAHLVAVFVLVFSELVIILFGLLKFRERIAFHTVLSCCWAFLLLWCFISLVCGDPASLSFRLAFWWGVAVQLEVLAIACILKRNAVGVPWIVKAIRQRKSLS